MQIISNDFLQDLVFDYYGNRMAICSSDRKIKIFEKNEKEEEWIQIAGWDVNLNLNSVTFRLMMHQYGNFNGLTLNSEL